jgi:hypothetical protein
MVWIGRALIGAGLLMMVWAATMNVTVADPSGLYSALANNDLMNQRLLFGMFGVGAFISGWLALILEQMKRG